MQLIRLEVVSVVNSPPFSRMILVDRPRFDRRPVPIDSCHSSIP
jgi:hypothetical protein